MPPFLHNLAARIFEAWRGHAPHAPQPTPEAPGAHEERVATIARMFPGKTLEAEMNADLRRRAAGDAYRAPVTPEYEALLQLFADWTRLSPEQVEHLRNEGCGAIAQQVIVFRSFGRRYQGFHVPTAAERAQALALSRTAVKETERRIRRRRPPRLRHAQRQRAPRRRLPTRSTRAASRDGPEPPGADEPPGAIVDPRRGSP